MTTELAGVVTITLLNAGTDPVLRTPLPAEYGESLPIHAGPFSEFKQQPQAAKVSTDLVSETCATELNNDPDMDFILDGVKLLSLDSMVSHAFTHNNKSALRPGAKNQIEAQLVTDHFAIADKANMPFIINALEVNECLTVSQKKPITPHFLLAFKGHLNLDNPLHATLWAVCLLTFFGFLRKANLQCKGFTQFDPSKHLRRGDILFFTDWASVFNRWSKTIQFSQRILTVPLPRIAQYPLCPYTALRHTFLLVPAPLSGPAFISPALTEGGLTALTYGKFDSLLKLLAAKTKIDPDIAFARAGPLWLFKLKSLQN